VPKHGPSLPVTSDRCCSVSRHFRERTSLTVARLEIVDLSVALSAGCPSSPPPGSPVRRRRGGVAGGRSQPPLYPLAAVRPQRDPGRILGPRDGRGREHRQASARSLRRLSAGPGPRSASLDCRAPRFESQARSGQAASRRCTPRPRRLAMASAPRSQLGPSFDRRSPSSARRSGRARSARTGVASTPAILIGSARNSVSPSSRSRLNRYSQSPASCEIRARCTRKSLLWSA
jgi:hypothetical protein